MEPTEQELKWAAAIKESAQKDPEVRDDVLCDLEYLQHAIVAKDQVQKALKRIKLLQKFKEQYGIKLDGSYEEGMRDLKAFQLAHPGFMLAVASLPDHTQVLCGDYSKYHGSNDKTEESRAITMRGNFYLLQVATPNVAAMRAGVVTLADGKGLAWKHMSFQAEERFARFYAAAYPARITKIVMMNANFVLRAFYNFCRMFISKKVASRHVFAGDVRAYLESSPYTPDVLPVQWEGKIDKEGLERAIHEKLRERYDTAAKFKL